MGIYGIMLSGCKRAVIGGAFLLLFMAVTGGVCRAQAAGEAIARQMDKYPLSRLTDIYKNFFQDRFGPGHIVRDTASAGAYLRMELQAMEGEPLTENSNFLEAEFTGSEHRFVRVNLNVIRSGMVTFGEFFGAFVASVAGGEKQEGEEPAAGHNEKLAAWKSEWADICKTVKKLYPELPGFGADSAALVQMLGQEEYVIHHSREYNEAYRPHYRLIKTEIWEKLQKNRKR
jgi:hypothetical protein